jgi:hypothetical protein
MKIFRLLEMPSFQLANSWYDQSYSEVYSYKDADCDANTLQRYSIMIFFKIIYLNIRFTETLVGVRRRHADIVPTFAQVNRIFN